MKQASRNIQMQGDQQLKEWQSAKQICWKVIQIARSAHLNNSNEVSNRPSNREFLSVYDIVYRLCLTKSNEENRTQMIFRQFKQILKQALLSMSQSLKTEQDIWKIQALKKIWDAWCDIKKRISHMFAYLDRSYQIKEGKIESLDKASVDIIKRTLFNAQLTDQFEAIYFKEIERIRNTQDYANERVIVNYVEILYKMHRTTINNHDKRARTMYTDFQSKYVKAARDHYQKKFKQYSQHHPCSYFEEINTLYEQQFRLVTNCYSVVGDTLIQAQFSNELLQKYRPILITSLKSIFRHRQIETLKIIMSLHLRLLNNIDGFKEQFQQFVCEQMKMHIQQMKNDLLIKKSLANSCLFIEKIIVKNKQLLEIVNEALNSLGQFALYYKNGVEKAFSMVQLAIPIQHTLAVYADSKLKNTALSEEQLGEQILNIVNIFSCLKWKDVFMKKYTQKMSKRLLTVSMEGAYNHEQFIRNLRLNSGGDYTSNLQLLLSEYHSNWQMEEAFKRHTSTQSIAISFKIFNQNVWPNPCLVEVPIECFPTCIRDGYKSIEQFKIKEMPKKKIRMSALDSKVMWLYYYDHKIEQNISHSHFQTNALQAVVLYFIYDNRPKSIPFAVIQDKFHYIDSKVLRDNLAKIVHLFIIETDRNESVITKANLKQETVYTFNDQMKFTKKMISFDITSLAEEEKLFSQQDFNKDREVAVQANIAKVMKSKKILDFQSLFNQLCKMIKLFVPSKKCIKLCIQKLIQKQIIVRDQLNINVIRYKN